MRYTLLLILLLGILSLSELSNASDKAISSGTHSPESKDEKAERLSREAFNLLNEMNSEAPLVFCTEVINDSSAASRTDSETCQSAIQILEEHDDKELISLIYNDLYLLFYHDGDYDSATLAAEKSLEIAEEINYPEMLGRGNQNFGILNSVQGRYPEAVQFFLESEKHYSELGNESALAMLYGNIGVTFEQAGNYAKAFEYTYKELSTARKIGNTSLEASALSNLGAIHSQGGSADSVLYYYEASLELAEQIDYKDLIITNLDNIGAYYSGINDYANARNYLNSAYELASDSEYQYQKIYITNNLAKNYLAEGLPDSALKYAEMQLDLATDYNFLYDQQLAWSNLSNIYAKNEDYQNALDARVKYSEIKDSLLDRDRLQQLENLREQYESEQREQTIEMLTFEAETATFRRNTYLASGLLISIILLLLYSSQRIKTRKNRQLLDKSKEVAEMKSNFFSNISHEFRTPLTLITGPIEMLKKDIEDPKLRNELDTMERNADRLLSLINQLLDLSRLESGKLELSMIQTDIVSIVKGVTLTFQSLAEIKQINLDVRSDTEYLEARVDKEKLETILINLISNAFKFTPDGGQIHIQLSQTTSTDSDESYLIRIKDNGKGIPEPEQDHIFGRFYRGTDSSKNHFEGSGIGLALTKELVELHKGSIHVNSTPGKGSEFIVELPIGRELFPEEKISGNPASDTERMISAPIKSESGSNGIKTDPTSPILLLIEDNVDVMNYLDNILNDSYQIIKAVDGEEGVNVALEIIPDLIISDVMMPKMDGYRVAEILKQDEKTSHIPLILLTAKASQEDKMQGLRAHADEYLTKPFRPEELRVRIQNLIESRRQLREKFKREFIMNPDEVSVDSLDNRFLMRVKKAVEEHIDDEAFTVEQLGREVGMSRSHLHRKLTALLGQSATEFIRSYRLHRAKEMISRDVASISEISYAVGYGSPSYFTKCFREEFGLTPSQVKQKIS